MTTKTNTNPWLMDSRVRERNLKSGALTEKDLEKHLAALPDLEGQYDAVATPQPALEQPRVAAPIVEESASDLDDIDEDEDESSDDVGGAAAASSEDVGGGESAGGGDEGGAVEPSVGGGSEPSEGGGEV